MPRASPPKTEHKPYSLPLSSSPEHDAKPDIRTNKTGKRTATKDADTDTPPHPNATKRNKAWTNDEYAALFAHVVRHGAASRTFDHAVEGRNRNQSYFTWKQVIEPYIYDTIAKKTKGSARPKKTGKDAAVKDESDA